MTDHSNAAVDTRYYSNPCEKVRTTCRRWVWEERSTQHGGKRSVDVQNDRVRELAEIILQKKRDAPSWIEWDEEHWHYQGDQFSGSEEDRQERVALYILALDAINFCFWPCEKYPEEKQINSLEYEHLAKGLKKLAEADDHCANDPMKIFAFSPQKLSETTLASMKQDLESNLEGHYLENMEKRAELWKELGTILLKEFDGSAIKMIKRAEGRAPLLVELIFKHFPGFQDETFVDSERIVFLKRAQIFVGDVNAALKLELKDMDQLTTFADYRVPQILRHFSILEYSPDLAATVDSGKEIAKGSNDEISIRAATVVGVEELVKFLNENNTLGQGGEPFTDVNVDWYLWQAGEKMHHSGLLKPFHKVRTHFY